MFYQLSAARSQGGLDVLKRNLYIVPPPSIHGTVWHLSEDPVAEPRRAISGPTRWSRHCRLAQLLIPSAPMKPAAKFRAMNDRRRPALPVVLLAVAQILLPSIAVVHAHSPEAVGFRGHAVDRPTVHAHGAGLAHEHSPGPAEDDRAKTGFRRLGVPTATLHDSTANWISSWKEAAAPPGMSKSGTPRGAARLGTLVFSCNPRAPDHFLGLSLEPESAARPSGWIAATRPLRGPPSSA